jgi:hypothetical protein
MELRAVQIARRCTEPGWRAAVLDERGSRHAFRLRASEEGSGFQAPGSASGASNVHGASGGVLSSGSDDDGGGFAMLAPPICRRRWRNNAFRSASPDEDGGNLANIAASGASN